MGPAWALRLPQPELERPCPALTLARMCLSLMMYSYVVSKTLNFPLRS